MGIQADVNNEAGNENTVTDPTATGTTATTGDAMMSPSFESESSGTDPTATGTTATTGDTMMSPSFQSESSGTDPTATGTSAITGDTMMSPSFQSESSGTSIPVLGGSTSPALSPPSTKKKKMKATSSSSSASLSKSDVVLEVLPNDVLMGSGTGSNVHIGNIKFRDLIASRKQEYVSTNKQQAKATIASKIADVILTTIGGRFLKKITPSAAAKIGYDTEEEEVEVYQIQDKATVLEKIKQALRSPSAGNAISSRTSRSSSSSTSFRQDNTATLEFQDWVKCDLCNKWRKINTAVTENQRWTCDNNTDDVDHNWCDAPEEKESVVNDSEEDRYAANTATTTTAAAAVGVGVGVGIGVDHHDPDHDHDQQNQQQQPYLISEYEQLRLDKIKRNEDKLKELGLYKYTDTNEYESEGRQSSKKRSKKTAKKITKKKKVVVFADANSNFRCKGNRNTLIFNPALANEDNYRDTYYLHHLFKAEDITNAGRRICENCPNGEPCTNAAVAIWEEMIESSPQLGYCIDCQLDHLGGFPHHLQFDMFPDVSNEDKIAMLEHCTARSDPLVQMPNDRLEIYCDACQLYAEENKVAIKDVCDGSSPCRKCVNRYFGDNNFTKAPDNYHLARIKRISQSVCGCNYSKVTTFNTRYSKLKLTNRKSSENKCPPIGGTAEAPDATNVIAWYIKSLVDNIRTAENPTGFFGWIEKTIPVSVRDGLKRKMHILICLSDQKLGAQILPPDFYALYNGGLRIRIRNSNNEEEIVNGFHIPFLHKKLLNYEAIKKTTVGISHLSHFSYDFNPFAHVWASAPCNSSLNGCLAVQVDPEEGKYVLRSVCEHDVMTDNGGTGRKCNRGGMAAFATTEKIKQQIYEWDDIKRCYPHMYDSLSKKWDDADGTDITHNLWRRVDGELEQVDWNVCPFTGNRLQICNQQGFLLNSNSTMVNDVEFDVSNWGVLSSSGSFYLPHWGHYKYN